MTEKRYMTEIEFKANHMLLSEKYFAAMEVAIEEAERLYDTDTPEGEDKATAYVVMARNRWHGLNSMSVWERNGQADCRPRIHEYKG